MIKLDDLAFSNFRMRKLFKGASVSRLIRDGQWSEVIAYNQKDCVLTAKLYELLLRKQEFRFNPNRRSVRIRRASFQELGKQSPVIDYEAWQENVRRFGVGYPVIKYSGHIPRICKKCGGFYVIRGTAGMPPLYQYIPFPCCPVCGGSLSHPHQHGRNFSESHAYVRAGGKKIRIDSKICSKCDDGYFSVSEKIIKDGQLRADCGFLIEQKQGGRKAGGIAHGWYRG